MRQWPTAGPVSRAASRLCPARNSTWYAPPAHRAAAAACCRLAVQARNRLASAGCSASSGQASSRAAAAVAAASARSESGVAASTAARRACCSRTRPPSTWIRPVLRRLASAERTRPGPSAPPGDRAAKSATAWAAKTGSGIPAEPSRAATARQTWGAPPGASSSAHSTDRVQVTAIAAGAAAGDAGDLLAPLDVQVVVVPAADPGAGDRGAGLDQRQRVAAEFLDEVDRAEPLVRVRAQPGHQVGQALVRAERPDGEDDRVHGVGHRDAGARPSPARGRPGRGATALRRRRDRPGRP